MTEIKNGLLTKTIPFVALSITDLFSRVTSLTNLVVSYSINGGAEANMATPAATLRGNGVFWLAIDEAAVVALPGGFDSVTVTLDITADEMVDTTITFRLYKDILDRTGITAGGTWTLSKILKNILASAMGKYQLKSGETEVFEILDGEDSTTVINEETGSENSPYRTPNVL